MSTSELLDLEEALSSKKQIILEGPPGSGKTYLADLFARYLTGNPLKGEHNEQIEIVQFHQSYGYEDFVQGIRPVTDDQGRLQYRVTPGIFLQLCERAKANPDKTFVLIIDEINRGNLSRVFGELLMLLEYRDRRVRLPYSVGDQPAYLEIPANLSLIGTMNSTDRSLAMIDYALRRRFYFYRLKPVENGEAPVLARWLNGQPAFSPIERQRILHYFIGVNERVSQQLTPDFQVGHSYFMDPAINSPETLARIWRHALRPLLEEYFHASRAKHAEIETFAPGAFLRADSPSGADQEEGADEDDLGA
jgi:5-methylcytosine-specific restriction protein B